MPAFEFVSVQFTLQYNTKFGEEIRVAGSNAKLGSWNAENAPLLMWSSGGSWNLELQFNKDEIPFEYKYIITKLEKKKRKVPASTRSNEGEQQEIEIEIEELTARWESTPNRIVKGDKAKVTLRDKWEKKQQTEAEIALEERNILLEDLKSLESLIFPSFTQFPRRIGFKEFAIGVIGELDKTNSIGMPKDQHRTVFMEGVLRKNEDNHYQLYWLGRQCFASNKLGEKKYDVTEFLPLEYKRLTYDDKTASEIPESTFEDSTYDHIKTIENVHQHLGGDGKQTSEGFVWEPLNRKWLFYPRLTASSVSRKQRRSSELEIPSIDDSPVSSVRVTSQNKVSGTTTYQYVPGETDIIAIKTTQSDDDAFTYLTVYDKDGRTIMPRVYVGPIKYEGVLLLKDLDAFLNEKYVASIECDTELRRREQDVREKIESMQIKYTSLKEQEIQEQETQKSS